MKIEILKNGQVIESRDFTDGSYKIGRAEDCEIRLKSQAVSKHHGLLIVKEGKAAIVDTGSSNGIFVNNVLVKKQRIREGDDVAIAEFKISVGNVRRLDASRAQNAGGYDGNLAYQQSPEFAPDQQPASKPLSMLDKVNGLLDSMIIHPFLDLNTTLDLKTILAFVFGGTLAVSIGFSIFTLSQWGLSQTSEEALKRAHSSLTQTVRENTRILAETNDYARLTVQPASEEIGMSSVFVVEPGTNLVLAPNNLHKTPLRESQMQELVSEIQQQQLERLSISMGGGAYAVGQPLYLYGGQDGSRTLVAVVVGVFEISDGLNSSYDRMLISVLFGILIGMLAYLVTMKLIDTPLNKLAEQVDVALKTEQSSVSLSTKHPALENLVTVVNFALGKNARNIRSNIDMSLGQVEVQDNFRLHVEELDQVSTDGLLLIDSEKKIVFVGNSFTELTGIKQEYSIGRNISEVFQDVGVSGVFVELSERVLSNFGELQSGEISLNGNLRKVFCLGHKSPSGGISYILLTVRVENA